MPERSEDRLVLTNFRKSPSRAQNRAWEVTLTLSPLKTIPNACDSDTSRSLLKQGFVHISLFAQGHQTRRKAKRKIVQG
jgi:hypothetical protein